jgi:hypothetical protein
MKKHLLAPILASALLAAPATVAGVASAAPAPHIVAAFPDTLGFNSAGGYVLYSNGKVDALDGAPFYGDARRTGLNDFATLAEDTQGNSGYWLVTTTGKVYPYGGLCQGDTIQEPKITGPIVGTLTLTLGQQNSGSVDDGFQMVNARGTVYPYLCVISF